MAVTGKVFFPRFHLPSPPSPRRRSVGVRVTSSTSASPSNLRQRRPENVDGEFFVDRKCIDCDACRWLAPETFTRIGDQSAVFKQPQSDHEITRALQALLCCPTYSIHSQKPQTEIEKVKMTFPSPIDEKNIPGVYYCGYHSEKTFGATSYLIVHPEGNILVDSPRYVESLATHIEKLGGVRYLFLTHRDDVGDHEKWARRFSCERILHSGDVEASTAGVEMQLFGDGSWSIGEDFELIHTPGHTSGSVCLLYKPLQILFTGDHLAKSVGSELTIFEQYNHDSVKKQLDSVRKFLDLDILWILPGHGRKIQFKGPQEKNSTLQNFLAIKEQEHVSN